MNAGDTFRIPEPGTSLDSHLWVIISDPAIDAERILIVNFTTLRADSERACILSAGEHPFVNHDTCVNYGGAKIVSARQIDFLLTKGKLSNHAALSEALLQKIRFGAANSTRMSLEHADILIDQGLIEC
jgi:hypothetical protein